MNSLDSCSALPTGGLSTSPMPKLLPSGALDGAGVRALIPTSELEKANGLYVEYLAAVPPAESSQSFRHGSSSFESTASGRTLVERLKIHDVGAKGVRGGASFQLDETDSDESSVISELMGPC